MTTYLVCEKDERFPFSAKPDSPEAVAIEIAVAIEHEYCEYQLVAYKADSNEALTARLCDRAIYELDLDSDTLNSWVEEGRLLSGGYEQLDLREEFFHACNDIERKMSDLRRICNNSSYFDGIDFDIDHYLDNAANEFFQDIEYSLQKKFTNLYQFKALASNA
ncbi:hypothetical protein [Polynucleobacter sp. JS-Fieb-80-E5]|uniref:hypothetical protein n=1 Tax=Polynucleobacter sp. JS-Fieb-80-E5 TaxID=2081050 RepID=UPI001C0B87DE|nr:hypothetical protein [Polynucleobacter sp. JS-Fieb-80-E5]MBU3618804.1 hypothetical protein [Polynucleobacter sp. JS-Fieb-80-E5]